MSCGHFNGNRSECVKVMSLVRIADSLEIMTGFVEEQASAQTDPTP